MLKMVKMDVSEKERSLIERLRLIPFGDVHVFMQEGQPQRLEKIKESEKL